MKSNCLFLPGRARIQPQQLFKKKFNYEKVFDEKLYYKFWKRNLIRKT